MFGTWMRDGHPAPEILAGVIPLRGVMGLELKPRLPNTKLPHSTPI